MSPGDTATGCGREEMSALREGIAAVVGPHGLVTDAATLEPFLIDWRKRCIGKA